MSEVQDAASPSPLGKPADSPDHKTVRGVSAPGGPSERGNDMDESAVTPSDLERREALEVARKVRGCACGHMKTLADIGCTPCQEVLPALLAFRRPAEAEARVL